MKTIQFIIVFLLLSVVTYAQDAAVSEKGCEVYLESKKAFVVVEGFHVLGERKNQGRLEIPGVKNEDIKAVRCSRTSVVPVVGDARVLEAGWPFYIAASRPDGQSVIVVLEVSGGQYRLRTITGQLNEVESGEVQRALDAIQESAQQAVPADRPKAGSG